MLETFENLTIDVYDTEEFCPINRGQIRFVDFGEVDPQTRDIGKCRPSIIVQSDEYNSMGDAKIAVVPLSKSPMYTCYNDKLVGVRIHGNNYPSILCTNEFSMVKKQQVREYICKCPQEVMDILEEYFANRFGFALKSKESETDTSLPGEVLEGTKIYKRYLEEANRIIALNVQLNPDWVRTLSIAECRNFAAIVSVLGCSYFKDTPSYNERTFNTAVKTAKTRSDLVVYPLPEIGAAAAV